jgi:hypothetical protein
MILMMVLLISARCGDSRDGGEQGEEAVSPPQENVSQLSPLLYSKEAKMMPPAHPYCQQHG